MQKCEGCFNEKITQLLNNFIWEHSVYQKLISWDAELNVWRKCFLTNILKRLFWQLWKSNSLFQDPVYYVVTQYYTVLVLQQSFDKNQIYAFTNSDTQIHESKFLPLFVKTFLFLIYLLGKFLSFWYTLFQYSLINYSDLGNYSQCKVINFHFIYVPPHFV